MPRLEKEVPNQPTKEALINDPLLARFTLIIDREGYSPDWMLRLKQQHIACINYHKYPGEDWPEAEFTQQSVTLVTGEVVDTG